MKQYKLNLSQWSWISYDFANSAYHLLIPTILVPLYFKGITASYIENSDFVWSIIVSVPIFLSALVSPFLGAVIDRANLLRASFISTAMLTIVTCFLMSAISPEGHWHIITLFMVGMFFFNLSQSTYNAFLPSESASNDSALLSGLGWGIGYLGGIICMIPVLYLIEGKPIVEHATNYQLSFLLVAAFYLVFSLPSFLFLRQPSGDKLKLSYKDVHTSFRDILCLLKEWRKHKNLFKFLLAIYLVNDGLTTLVFFTSIYASTTLNLSTSQIFTAFLIVQAVAIPMTILISYFASKFGYKQIFVITIYIWVVVSVCFFLVESETQFYLLSCLVGCVIGSTPALMRSLLARYFMEQLKEGTLFGFYAFSSRASSVIGPVLFGIISILTGSQSLAIGSIIFFFIAALLLLRSVVFSENIHSVSDTR